jgi:SAM-dependent methyltransferase
LTAACGERPASVLDVGCGYGRLSRALRSARADVRVAGVDLSPTFARLYPGYAGGPAVVGQLEALPIRAACFDLVLLVTTIMYVSEAQRADVVRQCLAALRPEGRLLLVETGRRGREISSGFGLLTRVARLFGGVETSVDTGGHAFAALEVEALIARAGGEVQRRSGVAAFTVLLPLLVVLSRLGAEAAVTALLRRCTPSARASDYSLHMCYEVRRAPAGAG